jgi:hypothetical protein
MTCPSCFWQHTNVQTALACYRRSNPVPMEDRPRGDGAIPPVRQAVDSGSPEIPSPRPTNPSTSKTVFRHGRAGKSGRPRVPTVEQRRKARERSREYRERQKKRESVRRESVSGVPQSAVLPSPGPDCV